MVNDHVPQYRQHSRTSGWSCPPHPLQFVGWIFYIFFGLIYFTTLVPGLPTVEGQIVAHVFLGIVFLANFIVHVAAVSLNPADVSVRRKTKKSIPPFDRTKHKHVIENQHCYLCEVNVGSRSKHCSACNKCIADFDHHCKWLNNCVGSRNYWFFISTLVSAIIACVVILVLCVVQFVAYYTDGEDGSLLRQYKEYLSTTTTVISFSVITSSSAAVLPNHTSALFSVLYQHVDHQVWLGVVGCTAILALLAVALLLHLLGFHLYLMSKGMSTYDYIVTQRERAEENARHNDIEVEDCTTPKRSKKNKIVPADESIELSKKISCESNGGIFGNNINKEYERVLAEEHIHKAEIIKTISFTPPDSPDKSDSADTHIKVNSEKEDKILKRLKFKKKKIRTDTIPETEMSAKEPNSYKPRGYNPIMNSKSLDVPASLPSIYQSPRISGVRGVPFLPYMAYHSDSAESLHEIPVPSPSPRRGSYQAGTDYSFQRNGIQSSACNLIPGINNRNRLSNDFNSLLQSQSRFHRSASFDGSSSTGTSVIFNTENSYEYPSKNLPAEPMTHSAQQRQFYGIPRLDISKLENNEDSTYNTLTSPMVLHKQKLKLDTVESDAS